MQKNSSKYIKSFALNRSRSGKNDEIYLEKLSFLNIENNKNLVQKILKNNKIMIEIGSGQGHFITNFAKNHQNYTCIACEVYKQGNINTIKKMTISNMENIYFYSNDARIFIENLPNETVDFFAILFPDPWPKNKHNKRRIINNELILLLLSKLKQNGKVLIATDDFVYQQHIFSVLSTINVNFVAKSEEYFLKNNEFSYIATRYHNKAMQENRQSKFFIIKKT